MNERIELYFNQKLPPEEREEFEKELLLNPQLAEEVAFYLGTREVVREQILAERHAEWQKLAIQPKERLHSDTVGRPVRTLQPWYYATAAVLLIALGMVWFWLNMLTPDIQELADAYVEENFTDLSNQMGGESDSLQIGIESYNAGQYTTTQTIGKELLERNAENAEALKLLGITALRQEQYDQAITYFQRLAGRQDLYANPGTFYQALTYLQRGQPSDLDTARQLLQKVVSQDMEGKEEAEKWLAAMED